LHEDLRRCSSQEDLIPRSSTKRDLHQRETRKKKVTKLPIKMKLISVPVLIVDCQDMWVQDSPILQKKAEKRRLKAKKEFQRVMIATWSDSDSSESEDTEEQAVNLCSRANQTHDEETEYESSDDVDYSDFVEYSKDELARVLLKCIQCEQDYLSKIKSLRK